MLRRGLISWNQLSGFVIDVLLVWDLIVAGDHAHLNNIISKCIDFGGVGRCHTIKSVVSSVGDSDHNF